MLYAGLCIGACARLAKGLDAGIPAPVNAGKLS